MSRWGVLYIVWGDSWQPVLERSRESLRRHHPDLPVHVEVLQRFDEPDKPLHAKADMLNLSPFEHTLFLDADTVVLGDLSFAMDKADRFGLALSICECPWAHRFAGISGDVVEYNTGVLFFTRAARPVFDLWAERVRDTASSTRWLDADGNLRGMEHNDQASFALAVEQSGLNPYVLPFNWNFRPRWHRSFFAPVKIWHDYADPPANLVEACDRIAAGRQPPSYMEFRQPGG